MQSTEKPFDVIVERAERIITIQGIRYTFDLFDQLGFAAEGTRFEIGKRSDGVIELRTFPTTEAYESAMARATETYESAMAQLHGPDLTREG